MIFFMTYNIYVILSMIVGNGIGYYLFAFDNNDKEIRKTVTIGCCHNE